MENTRRNRQGTKIDQLVQEVNQLFETQLFAVDHELDEMFRLHSLRQLSDKQRITPNISVGKNQTSRSWTLNGTWNDGFTVPNANFTS